MDSRGPGGKGPCGCARLFRFAGVFTWGAGAALWWIASRSSRPLRDRGGAGQVPLRGRSGPGRPALVWPVRGPGRSTRLLLLGFLPAAASPLGAAATEASLPPQPPEEIEYDRQGQDTERHGAPPLGYAPNASGMHPVRPSCLPDPLQVRFPLPWAGRASFRHILTPPLPEAHRRSGIHSLRSAPGSRGATKKSQNPTSRRPGAWNLLRPESLQSAQIFAGCTSSRVDGGMVGVNPPQAPGGAGRPGRGVGPA